jgi:hypothetical protein
MTAALAMQPIVIRGIRATFVLLLSCKCHTKKPGMMANVKSEMIEKMLYTYPRAVMTVLSTHFPSCEVRSHMYETG